MLLLALRQLRDGGVQRLLGQLDLDLLLRRRLGAREQVAVRRRVVLADRLVERRNGARRGAHLLTCFSGSFACVRDLLVRRRPLERREQLSLGAR